MFNPLKNLSDIASLQKQAKEMQSALQKEEVIIEMKGVRIVLSGDQQIREVVIDGVLENRVAQAINEGIKKTQKLAASKLMQMTQEK